MDFLFWPHPPYSPDLSPSDFYLFSPLKNAVRGKNYENSVDIQKDIKDWYESKPAKFFSDGINQLPERWQKCLDRSGDYFQHFKETDE